MILLSVRLRRENKLFTSFNRMGTPEHLQWHLHIYLYFFSSRYHIFHQKINKFKPRIQFNFRCSKATKIFLKKSHGWLKGIRVFNAFEIPETSFLLASMFTFNIILINFITFPSPLLPKIFYKQWKIKLEIAYNTNFWQKQWRRK